MSSGNFENYCLTQINKVNIDMCEKSYKKYNHFIKNIITVD